MTTAIQRPVSDRFALGALILFATFVLLFVGAAAVLRGPWYDEYWSLWMSHPGGAIADIVRGRWFRDVHPPLFYLGNWLLWPAVGPGVVAHRLLNLFAVAYLGGVAAYVARRFPAMRAMLVVLLGLVLSNRDFEYLAEQRSYLWMLCTSSAAVMLLYRITLAEHDLNAARDRGLAVLVAITILIALNIHYIGAMITAAAVGVVALDQLRLGHRRWAALMIGVGMIASLPLLASLFAERAYMAEALPGFWIQTGVFQAFRFLVGQILRATGVNLVLIGCLALVVMAALRGRGSGASEAPLRADWHFAILMALAAIAASIVLLVASTFRPTVVPRYLIAMTPICAGALAALTGRLILSRMWLYALFLLNGAAMVMPRSIHDMREENWYESAAMVAAQVRACPLTKVYALSRYDVPPAIAGTALPNENEFLNWAMPTLAQQYGFRTIVLRRAPPGVVAARSPAGCPTILWLEHAGDPVDPIGAIAAAGISLAPAEQVRVRSQHTHTRGVIVTIPPR